MKGSLCILPWIHIETTPLGNIRPCCKSLEFVRDDNEGSLHLSKATLEDAWNSQFMQDLRAKFLAGERPASCERCWKEEAAGTKSKRLIDNERFSQHVDRVYGTVAPPPVYFDLKLGNICNLKCRSCSSYSSSKWVEEERSVPGKQGLAITHAELGKWIDTNPKFWEYIDRNLGQVKFFDFTGGEPFLIREHFELLERCVEQGHASHISIHYNTNGTIFPGEKTQRLWSHFKKVEVMCSIDGIGKRFEYLRHPAQWSEVIRNLERFQMDPHIHFTLCHTVSVLNVFYLDEFFKWAKSKGFEFWLNTLHEPIHYNVQRLPRPQREAIAARLKKIRPHTKELKKSLKALHSYLLIDSDEPTALEEFYHWTNISDEFRAENFSRTFPEFHEVLTQ